MRSTTRRSPRERRFTQRTGPRSAACDQIVDNYREHILDGIVIVDGDGEVRFVDGPEVTRTFEHGVLLSIDAGQVAALGPPEDGPGVFGARRPRGRLGRIFGGHWKRH